MRLQVQRFDKRVESESAAAERTVAVVKGIGRRFQECCSVADVRICERKLQFLTATAKHDIFTGLNQLNHDSGLELEAIIMQCDRCDVQAMQVRCVMCQCTYAAGGTHGPM